MQRPGPEKIFSESIYERLREEILRGDLKPGERLTEQDIARRMGTSQGPVREALAKLRPQGLIVTLPHRGSFVTEISTEHAREIYAVRILLERHAAALALPKMTNADIRELRALVVTMVSAAAAGEFLKSVGHDMAFHRRIVEIAGAQILLQLWEIIEAQTTKFVAVVAPQVFEDTAKIASTHFVLIEAMEARDLPRLNREIEEHLTRIWAAFESGNGGKAAPNY